MKTAVHLLDVAIVAAYSRRSPRSACTSRAARPIWTNSSAPVGRWRGCRSDCRWCRRSTAASTIWWQPSSTIR